MKMTKNWFLFLLATYLLVVMTACARGPQGNAGPQGETGDPGFSPVPIQLCAACTTHYPDTYAEVVFCYNGNLYGTYSANGGFSTELPQGSYSSSGINCSCTVAIGPDCQVTP